jgi:hypothetical protein
LLLCDNGKEFGFACGIHALVYPTKSQIMLGAVLRGGWVVTFFESEGEDFFITSLSILMTITRSWQCKNF